MRSTIRTGTLLLTAALFTTTATFAGGPVELKVDCDAGDNLYKALDYVERHGGGRIKVIGTCFGTFVVGSAYVEIFGDSPATAAIQAGAGPALIATGAGWLRVVNMRLAGGEGILGSGNQRIVGLANCEIEADWNAVRVDGGAALVAEDSLLSGGQNAVIASDADVYVDGGRLHDSTFAARLFRGSISLRDTEVTDNQLGILATDRSTVDVAGGRFADNGQIHLAGTTGSRIAMYNTAIGSFGDPTFVALYADRDVAMEIYYGDPQVEIWGSATILDDSFMSFEGGTIHGSIALRGFSRLLLDGWVQDGIVDCQTAGDAWCGHGASAFSAGCASMPANCQPGSAGTGENREFLPLIPELPAD